MDERVKLYFEYVNVVIDMNRVANGGCRVR